MKEFFGSPPERGEGKKKGNSVCVGVCVGVGGGGGISGKQEIIQNEKGRRHGNAI